MPVWTQLARVRQLRVERARRLVNDARIGVQRAEAEAGWQRNAIAEHDAKRRSILAGCACGETSASLWRMALRRHDADRFALESALVVACDAQESAHERVASALHLLQREMRGLDYVQERMRNLVAALQEEGDSDE